MYRYDFQGGPGPRRLTRSSRERMWAGVAGGMAEYFDLDPVIVRLIWVAAAILSGGLAVPIYLVMWWLMPRDTQLTSSGYGWAQPSDVREPVGAGVASEGGAATAAEDASADDPAVGDDGAPRSEAPGSVPPGAPPFGGPPFGGPPPFVRPPFERGRRRQQTAGFILVVIGLLFLSERLGILGWMQFRYTWPLLLILLGVAMLFRQTGGWRR